MAGLALVLLGALGKVLVPLWVMWVGILVVVVGAGGLQYKTYKWKTRRVPSGLVPAPAPMVALGQALQAETTARETPVTINLASEFEEHRKLMRSPLTLARFGLAGAFAVFDALLLESGIRHGDSTLTTGGVALAPMIVLLFSVMWRVNRGVLSVSVDQQGITFYTKPGGRVFLAWNDHRFDLTVHETPASAVEPRDRVPRQPRYQVHTRAGGGQLGRVQIATNVPERVSQLLLQRSAEHGLTVQGPTVYRPGTMAELRVYRVTASPPGDPHNRSPGQAGPFSGPDSEDRNLPTRTRSMGPGKPTSRLGSPQTSCWLCRAAVPADAAFCGSCGAPRG